MAKPEINEIIMEGYSKIGGWIFDTDSQKFSIVIDSQKIQGSRLWTRRTCGSVLKKDPQGNKYCVNCTKTDCKIRDKFLSEEISAPEGNFSKF